MTARPVTIRPVTDVQTDHALLMQIAATLHNEWHELPRWQTADKVLSCLTKRVSDGNGEMLFVATGDNGELLATASLMRRELDTDRIPEAEWWVGEIFTLPAARGRGLGSEMTLAVADAAAAAGIPALNLYTPDKQAMYARLGWQPMYDTVVSGEDVTVMQRPLSV